MAFDRMKDFVILWSHANAHIKIPWSIDTIIKRGGFNSQCWRQ